MSTEGGLTVIEMFTSVEALVQLADNVLKHDTATQESTRFTIKKGVANEVFIICETETDII